MLKKLKAFLKKLVLQKRQKEIEKKLSEKKKASEKPEDTEKEEHPVG